MRTWMDKPETLREWKQRIAARKVPVAKPSGPLADAAIDATDMLRSGVYVLSLQGRVVHVGRSRCLLTTIADHRSLCTSKEQLPSWFPVRPVRFDSITIHPCTYAESTDLARALTKFHLPSREPREPGPSFSATPPPTTLPVITRRI